MARPGRKLPCRHIAFGLAGISLAVAALWHVLSNAAYAFAASTPSANSRLQGQVATSGAATKTLRQSPSKAGEPRAAYPASALCAAAAFAGGAVAVQRRLSVVAAGDGSSASDVIFLTLFGAGFWQFFGGGRRTTAVDLAPKKGAVQKPDAVAYSTTSASGTQLTTQVAQVASAAPVSSPPQGGSAATLITEGEALQLRRTAAPRASVRKPDLIFVPPAPAPPSPPAPEPIPAAPIGSAAESDAVKDGGSVAKDGGSLDRAGEPLEKAAEPLEKAAEPLKKAAEPLEKAAEPLEKAGVSLVKDDGSLLKAGVPLMKNDGLLLKDGVSMVKSPQDTYADLVKKGEGKAQMSGLKILYSSFMGGCYVGMAGLLSLAISGNMTNPSPGVQKFMFASLFPVNLLLVLQSGGQLFTGNTATMAVALLEGKVSKRGLLRIWATSYLGNLLGAGLIAFVALYTGLLTGGTADLASHVVVTKCSFTFGQTLVKAVMCNWLVCMAVYLAMSAQDLTGKMVGIWFPISMFVAIGFEHSVANMFLLPAGLLSGAHLSVTDVITKNLIPVTIGNMLAGAIVFGAGLSFAFGRLGAGDRGSFRGSLRNMRRGLSGLLRRRNAKVAMVRSSEEEGAASSVAAR